MVGNGYHGCGGLEVHIEWAGLIFLQFMLLYQLCSTKQQQTDSQLEFNQIWMILD